MKLLIFSILILASFETSAQTRIAARARGFAPADVSRAVGLTTSGECLLLKDSSMVCDKSFTTNQDFNDFIAANKIKQVTTWRDSVTHAGDDYIHREHILALTLAGDLVSHTTAKTKTANLGSAFIVWESDVDRIIEASPSTYRGLVLIKKNDFFESKPAFVDITNWDKLAPSFERKNSLSFLSPAKLENYLPGKIGYTIPGRHSGYFELYTDGNSIECVWCGINRRNVSFPLPEPVTEKAKIGAYYGDLFIIDSFNNIREVLPKNIHATQLDSFKKQYNGRIKFVFDSPSRDGGFVVFITKDGDYDIFDNAGFGDAYFKFSAEPMLVSRACAILKNDTVECVR